MANKTDADAVQVHGTNPQFLIEKILRQKIHGDAYWKEHCFALSAETIVDRAMELDHIGGTFGGNKKPAPFIQLCLKLLQIQPEKEIVVEFIKNEDFKYVRALGAFYMRMVGKPIDVYQYLEPLLNDYRKLRLITGNQMASHTKRDLKRPERMAWAGYTILYMDDFIDQLLTEDMVLDIALPTLPKRINLEDTGVLQPRISPLDDDLQDEDEEDLEEGETKVLPPPADLPPPRDTRAEPRDKHTESRDNRTESRDDRADGRAKRPRSLSPARKPRSPERDRDRGRDRGRTPPRRERSRSRDRRSRSRSRDRRRDRDRSRDRHRDRRSRSRDRRRSRSASRSRSRDRRRSRSRDRRRSRSRSRSRSDSDSRSRSRSRDRRRSRSRDRRSPSRSPPRKAKKEGKEKEEKKTKPKAAEVDTEIAEANALRESLGLKPLQKVDEWKKKH